MQCKMPSFEQPLETLKLIIIKAWRNFKTPESEEEWCYQIKAAILREDLKTDCSSSLLLANNFAVQAWGSLEKRQSANIWIGWDKKEVHFGGRQHEMSHGVKMEWYTWRMTWHGKQKAALRVCSLCEEGSERDMLRVSHLGFSLMVKMVFVQQGDGPRKSLVNKLDQSGYINYCLHTLQHVIT